jgi:Na+/H+ antiporter NhaC
MINFIVYLFTGLIIACWILCVADKELKAVYKLILSLALACFIGVVNSEYTLNILSLLACTAAVIITLCSYALCRAAKEN